MPVHDQVCFDGLTVTGTRTDCAIVRFATRPLVQSAFFQPDCHRAHANPPTSPGFPRRFHGLLLMRARKHDPVSTPHRCFAVHDFHRHDRRFAGFAAVP